MSKSLGRGLGALLRTGDDQAGAPVITDKKLELNRKIFEITKDIGELQKEIDEKRKNITVDIMFGRPVTKDELVLLEDEVKKKREERDLLKSELDILLSGSSGSPDIVINDETADPGVVRRSTDIDLRMVRELMPFEKGETEEEIIETTPEDDLYLEKLKMENHPSSSLPAVKRESLQMKEEMASKPTMEEIPEDELIEDPSIDDSIDGMEAEEPLLNGAISIDDEEKEVLPLPELKEIAVPVQKVEPETSSRPVASSTANKSMKRVRRIRRAVSTETPEYQRALYTTIIKANEMIEKGRIEDAIKILRRVYEDNSSDDEVLYHLGNAYFITGDLETAYEMLKKATRINPGSFRAYNNLGVILQKTGHYEEAIRSLNHALEINQKYERSWYNLGSLFMELNPPLLNEAVIFLKRAIEIDPNYAKAREKLRLCRDMQKSG